jgi:radical SAM protein (TIGR04043 family)/putative N-acetyltransferase (TIGR04045 family)
MATCKVTKQSRLIRMKPLSSPIPLSSPVEEEGKKFLPTRTIVTELQSLGLRLGVSLLKRKGGAGPAEGGTIVVAGRAISVPTGSHYVVRSPFELRNIDGVFWIFKNAAPLIPVEIASPPRFYGQRTADGVPYEKIALLHGRDCLATTIRQNCDNWRLGRPCRFCAIKVSLGAGATLPVKTPEQLAEVAWKAKDLDGIRQVVLTTGAASLLGDEVPFLSRCAAAIKRATGLPVHAQCLPPSEPESLVLLKAAGVDTIGLHIESFDREVLARMAPAKAAIGLPKYEQAWKEAVELFGANQVSSFLIVGLGEDQESVLQGSERLADLGVYPFVVPLRPIPGSEMEKDLPPDPGAMMDIYEKVAGILRRKGLSSKESLAGCVRCGACSALPFYEQPVEQIVCHPSRTRWELTRAMAIRHQVFVDEQQLFQETDADEYDRKSTHLIAELEGQVIGTVRVFPVDETGRWIGGRLAILKDRRGSGAGELLVKEAMRFVKKKGCTTFTALIQEENIPFFLQIGWRPSGVLHEYRGRVHRQMRADLSGT